VEDNPDARIVVAAQLQHLGYHAQAVAKTFLAVAIV
jgi:hypothetical protein